jgi:pimeloyl-ACP methyl ester carboxylesterase
MGMAPAYADPAFVTADLAARYHDMLLAPGVRTAMIARMEQAVLVPPEPILRTIAVPTLLVWGEKDALIPFTNAADYLRVMPRATLVSFPELGHLPHEEAPARSLAPVRAFLEAPIAAGPTGGGAT